MNKIRKFSELTNASVEQIGGKGLSLINMINAGFNVPNGFIIPVDVEIDSEVSKEIINIFDELNMNYVAVRSSATVEDGSKNSWAGQFSSYLNITKGTLIEHIKLVQKSIDNARANTYSNKTDSKNIKMAVVVQEMVDATHSGIAFSMNPVNQDTSVVVIESGLGLGEPIVSGMITPDCYEVNKSNLEILKKNINIQNKVLLRDGYKELDSKDASMQKLNDNKIIELASTIIKLEEHFNFPIDVEWAYNNDKLFILQSRPITKTKVSSINKIIQKINERKDYEAEGTGINFSWLVENALIKATGKEMQEKIFDFYTPFDGYFVVNGDEYMDLNSALATEDTFKVIYEKEGISFIEKHFNRMLELCDNVEKYRKELLKVNFSNLSIKDLTHTFKTFYEYFLDIFTSGINEPSSMLEEELRKKLSSIIKDEELEKCLTIVKTKSNLRDLDYVDEPLNLLYLAKEIKNEYGKNMPEKLSPYFTDKLENHILEYGYLQDLPEFYNDTKPSSEYYVDRIKFFIESDIDEKIKTILEARKKVEDDYANFINDYKISGDILTLCDMVRLCIMTRTYKVSFTDKLYYNAKYLGLFDEVAKRLNISVLDLQTMSSDEIINALNGDKKSLDLESRREGYYILWNEDVVDYGFGKNAGILQQMMSDKYINAEDYVDSNEKIIKGQSANMGIVKGRVKIVISSEDMDNFNEGDILVTTMTRPELIPVMEKAIGFITDEGGMTCHAAIVSREFNIPCIVGTTVATKALHDGDMVELDAIKGIVRII